MKGNGGGSLLATFFVAITVGLALTWLVGDASAATYVVGDDMDWRLTPINTDYADWASRHVFAVGDVLVFKFTTGVHDVAHVTKESYNACSTKNPISLITEGPASITLNSTGEDHYICTFGGHCSMGQKLAINVVAKSSKTPSPADDSSGGVSPTPLPPFSSTAFITMCTSFVILMISNLICYGIVVL